MKKTRSTIVLTGSILIVASMMIAWATFALQDRNRYFLSEGTQTQATITGKREISRAHKKSRMYVSYEFLIDNKTHSETTSWIGDTKTWKALK